MKKVIRYGINKTLLSFIGNANKVKYMPCIEESKYTSEVMEKTSL